MGDFQPLPSRHILALISFPPTVITLNLLKIKGCFQTWNSMDFVGKFIDRWHVDYRGSHVYRTRNSPYCKVCNINWLHDVTYSLPSCVINPSIRLKERAVVCPFTSLTWKCLLWDHSAIFYFLSCWSWGIICVKSRSTSNPLVFQYSFWVIAMPVLVCVCDRHGY